MREIFDYTPLPDGTAALARVYGDSPVLALPEALPGPGGPYYAFPTPERLAACTPEELAYLRAGWRVEYILDAARRVTEGLLDPETLRALPLARAKEILMECKGVGPKVADCTLLYGLGRWDAYPIDIWIKRADRALFTARVKDPAAYLNRRTGNCAGIAQQYIFAWARGNLCPETGIKKP